VIVDEKKLTSDHFCFLCYLQMSAKFDVMSLFTIL